MLYFIYLRVIRDSLGTDLSKGRSWSLLMLLPGKHEPRFLFDDFAADIAFWHRSTEAAWTVLQSVLVVIL